MQLGGGVAIVALFIGLLWVRGDLTAHPIIGTQVVSTPDGGRELLVFRKSGSGVQIESIPMSREWPPK